jgi:hypothetical protein
MKIATMLALSAVTVLPRPTTALGSGVASLRQARHPLSCNTSRRVITASSAPPRAPWERQTVQPFKPDIAPHHGPNLIFWDIQI